MERDIRRDRGQWRGCHSFKDIILEGEAGSSPKRNGGLKMGLTYYYYVRYATLPSGAPLNIFTNQHSVRVGRVYRDTRPFVAVDHYLPLLTWPDCQHTLAPGRAERQEAECLSQLRPR